MNTFDECFTALIGNEGGLSMVASDPGNWTGGHVNSGVLKGTKYGIAARSYPALDIKNLTLDDAREIYLRDFWTPAGCAAAPPEVAFDLFDTAVNSSVHTAARMLQRAAGVQDDGIIGPASQAAISAKEPLRLLIHFEAERLDYLNDLTIWPDFGKGWTQRIANNMKRV